MNRILSSKNIPLSVFFHRLAKKYLTILVDRLQHKTGLNRYFYVLVMIHKNNGKLTQQKLSDLFNTNKVITVRIIDYLSKNGLVKREVNVTDRREHLLTLTAKGEKYVPVIVQEYEEIEALVFKGINAQRKKDFYDCLSIMESNLLKMNNKENLKK